jgi:hypothetical protein
MSMVFVLVSIAILFMGGPFALAQQTMPPPKSQEVTAYQYPVPSTKYFECASVRRCRPYLHTPFPTLHLNRFQFKFWWKSQKPILQKDWKFKKKPIPIFGMGFFPVTIPD